MKKLTRKSLDELAKTMPIVSKTQQNGFIGGAMYFDSNGNFVGSYGEGNGIIIAPTILHSGISFDVASPETVGKVMTTMARAVGISGNVNIIFDRGDLYGRAHEDGSVDFNYNANIMAHNNYYDFLSVLHHENHHLMSMEDAGTSQSEFQALIYEINQPSFQNTSEYYRSNTMYQYNSYIPSGYNYPSGNYDPSGNY
ncbi:hypothetical protein [Proteiniphilum sp. X52]|jgi:hypothetical protein|uniref:hypothetical protein n=1 Tax=Proteiniphilum sp. X52 TaxID=2382159 RepID=UPI000F0A5825|nr:hypothetical protein [Proteiniphilum sp. X52]RNC65980.1 hypothetical protein D7D25_05590 [Proteiniphilum sp. X52]HMM18642.1 hypothetical protein [Petrimonas sp.]